MPTSSDHGALTHEFLGVADRVNRLRTTEPTTTTLEVDRLKRWQVLFAEEAAQVEERRQQLLDRPATVTTADLAEWLEHARRTLTQNPPDTFPPGSPAQSPLPED
ncbi:hypothetical protein ACEZDB_11985 [Streptacidiphilus sp. N1-3]|uniref:Uncharacterized protein n=1 Tax=Streptacidiphilus alkalitolerans TaxID=3342712 RepID=A0ABV6WZH5_9ACTN